MGSGFRVPRNPERETSCGFRVPRNPLWVPVPGNPEPISTFCEKTVKGYVNIPLRLKMDKNGFSNGFAFLGNGMLRNENSDTPNLRMLKI
jgi:hypothetical protein